MADIVFHVERDQHTVAVHRAGATDASPYRTALGLREDSTSVARSPRGGMDGCVGEAFPVKLSPWSRHRLESSEHMNRIARWGTHALLHVKPSGGSHC